MDKRYKGYKEISGTFWYTFINSAKVRNIDVEIDINYIWDLFLKQNRKCSLSGNYLIIDNFYRPKKKLNEKTFFASLDRINNDKGYIEGNVRWIVREINFMKWKLDEDKFLYLCEKISNNI